MDKIDKIHWTTDFDEAKSLYWYTAVYLGLPNVFTSVLRRKLAGSSVVKAIIIPTSTVTDPVSGSQISIHLTDRYFFIGTTQKVHKESELGIHSSLTSITLLRNHDGVNSPSIISLSEIDSVVDTHLCRRRETLQEMVNIIITGGTFKEWYGTVTGKPSNDNVGVKVSSDEYHFEVDMPIALCKPT